MYIFAAYLQKINVVVRLTNISIDETSIFDYKNFGKVEFRFKYKTNGVVYNLYWKNKKEVKYINCVSCHNDCTTSEFCQS